MSTLMIELEEEQFAGLKKTASRFGYTAEALAQKVLIQLLDSERTAEPAWVDEQTFERALQQSLKENDELYRRLAR